MKPELTPREIEILCLITDGLRNKEIADRVGISVKTVEFHKSQIYSKIGAGGAVEAVRFAIREGYIAPRDFGRSAAPSPKPDAALGRDG